MGIHKYKLFDEYILLDVNSSLVFEIDELIYDLLDYYPKVSQNEAICRLKNKYSAKQIKEGINEIDELICAGKLFTNELQVDMSKIKTTPIKAICLHVSHDCNLACMYCFASGGDFNTHCRKLMSLDVAKASVDFLIRESMQIKHLEIDFFGGEPLMNFDVVKETVAYAEEQGRIYGKQFRFTITTNCVGLDEEKLSFINEHMYNLVMSLDGRKSVQDNARPTPNGKGSYDLIIDKIAAAVKSREKKDYFVRGTYTSCNLDFANDVDHMASLGFHKLSVEPVVSPDTEPYAIKEEHLPILFKEYEKLTKLYLSKIGTSNEFSFFHFNIDLNHETCPYKKISGCGAGCSYVAVTPDGEIYPCHQFVGEEAFLLGDVYHGIDEKNKSIIEEFRDTTILTNPSCKDCWAKYFCGGGCRANSYHFTNTLSGKYEIGCELQKKRIECALYLQAHKKITLDTENIGKDREDILQ